MNYFYIEYNNIVKFINNALASLYAALLLGYTIHFIYCIWGNLLISGCMQIAPNASGG